MFERICYGFTNDDGTGWRATVPFLVLYENGYDNISVYDGGWYEWLMHDDYPVQVGDPASDECVHTTVGELSTGSDKIKQSRECREFLRKYNTKIRGAVTGYQ